MSAQVLNQLTTSNDQTADDHHSVSSGSDSALIRPPPIPRSDAVDSSTDGQGSDDSPVIVYRNHSPSNSSTCSRDSVVTLKHYDCLLGELRCPGCARPMCSPIFLCKSGHSVCKLCTETLINCPVCKQTFADIRSVRNLTLEALAEKAYFLCKYSQHGCTVRLPYHLMRWHKERCVYQVGDCFMGKVWGGCSWSGCEIDWIKHCTDYHSDRLFTVAEAQLFWNYSATKRSKSVLGFYIFQAFGETFNLYHIYDKALAKTKWTMVCASKRDEKAYRNYAFQVELFVPEDASRMLIQRHSCHGERDDDVLEEARCVCFSMGDVMRFMSPDKILNYRVEILDVRELHRDYVLPQLELIAKEEDEGEETTVDRIPIKLITAEDEISINECTNHKLVPTENIIKRKSADLSRMIATIDEEEFAEDHHVDNRKAKVSTNGPIVVHSHNGTSDRSSVYSVCAAKSSPLAAKERKVKAQPMMDDDEEEEDAEERKANRKNSKSNLLKDFNGGYDSVKRMLQKTMSIDRTNKIEKPPRRFLTLNNRRSHSGASGADATGEFNYEDSMSLKVRRSGSTGDIQAADDTCSLPDKIPTTPPPKKTPNKKASSFINLMRSNLKF